MGPNSLFTRLFFTYKNCYEKPIKPTPDPSEKSISMAGSTILQCHHLGQLLSFLISATKFFTAIAGEKSVNQFKDIAAYLAIPGPVGVNST
jgi:hypothetical protein